jgi:hypothetical protein
MKTKSLIIAVMLGALASTSAHAFGYWNNATYASRFRPAPETQTQAKPEVQVAVLASADAKSAKSVKNDHRFGPPKPYETRSH